MTHILRENLLSPPILAFGIGLLAAASGLRPVAHVQLPTWLSKALSLSLLGTIGLKGGMALAESHLRELWLPSVAALTLGCTTPVLAFTALRRLARLPREDAAAVSAHYGSVSVVTFTAGLAFVRLAGLPYEGFMPTLLALLEAPGILVALLLARGAGRLSLRQAALDVASGPSFLALGSGIAVGLAAGPLGGSATPPGFNTVFLTLLTVFLLEMGVLAGRHLRRARTVGPVLLGFALVAPLVNGGLGVLLGKAAGLSIAGTMLLGVLGASASYIAAPAAVRLALPQVDPARYLTPVLGVTFPFNLTIGLPVYLFLARLVH
ncbi:MAG: sodium-dependent bicarbonate transport family permease [Actinomycetota bacterium]|jgi:hypothetical protein|nr:MAG: sodium-dependent bicarbonate transport family permease [Actinomycetota bacterium]